MTCPAGMLVIDKPAGRTSHDVVAQVRGRLACKAGHTGTLDPQATGVLLVCLGSATRLSRFLQHQDKVYEYVVRLGWETDTYDAEGEPLADPVTPPQIGDGEVAEVLGRFVGVIRQVPPVYSAKKIRGQPSYRRARRGEQVEHRPVEVRIHQLGLLERDPDSLRLVVHCGPGTYVRTLAVDIGRALGCPAHLAALRRLAVGEFRVQDAVGWEIVEDADPQALKRSIVPAAEMFPDWPAAVVAPAGAEVIRNGGVLEPRHVTERRPGRSGAVITGGGEGTWIRLLDADGRMLAAAEPRPGGMLQPRIVLR